MDLFRVFIFIKKKIKPKKHHPKKKITKYLSCARTYLSQKKKTETTQVSNFQLTYVGPNDINKGLQISVYIYIFKKNCF